MSTIPKIIHQIWFQGESQIPDKYHPYQKSWRQLHSDWDYHLWDETQIERFIKSRCPQYWNKYQSFPYMHQKIDFFKYLILYYQGGLYADMDSYALKPIDSLLDQIPNATTIVSEAAGNRLEHLASTGSTETMINNGIMLAAPNGIFWKKLIETVVDTPTCPDKQSQYKCIENTTGPLIFSQSVHKYVDTTGDPNFSILPSEYLEPCYGKDWSCHHSDKSYANHKHSQTWLNSGELSVIHFYFLFKNILYYSGFFIIAYVIYVWLKNKLN